MAGIAVGPEIQTYDFPGGSSGEGTHTRPQQIMWEVIPRARGGDDSFEFVLVRGTDPVQVVPAAGKEAGGVLVTPRAVAPSRRAVPAE
jgi:hypothetical protein